MISENIYIHSMEDRTPYTYLIGWRDLDAWYYGRRTAKNCHPEELFIKYFTSSNIVTQFRAEHGEPDVIKIHKYYSNVEECVKQEERFLKRMDAARNLRFLNQSNSDRCFDRTGTVTVKDENDKISTVHTNNPLYTTGKLVGHTKNKVRVISITDPNKKVFLDYINSDEIASGKYIYCCASGGSENKGKATVKYPNTDKYFHVNVGDNRILNKELIYASTGMVIVKDIDGNTFRLPINDPKYISGEVKHITSGLIYEVITCPHCNFSGGGGSMTRYHFDNCPLIASKNLISDFTEKLYSVQELSKLYNISTIILHRKIRDILSATEINDVNIRRKSNGGKHIKSLITYDINDIIDDFLTENYSTKDLGIKYNITSVTVLEKLKTILNSKSINLISNKVKNRNSPKTIIPESVLDSIISDFLTEKFSKKDLVVKHGYNTVIIDRQLKRVLSKGVVSKIYYNVLYPNNLSENNLKSVLDDYLSESFTYLELSVKYNVTRNYIQTYICKTVPLNDRKTVDINMRKNRRIK